MPESKKQVEPTTPQAFEPVAAPEEKLTAEEQRAKDDFDRNEALKARIDAKGRASRVVRLRADD
jgi:hypothetical protein